MIYFDLICEFVKSQTMHVTTCCEKSKMVFFPNGFRISSNFNIPEYKKVLSRSVICIHNVFFQFVKSEETSFSSWSRKRKNNFLKTVLLTNEAIVENRFCLLNCGVSFSRISLITASDNLSQIFLEFEKELGNEKEDIICIEKDVHLLYFLYTNLQEKIKLFLESQLNIPVVLAPNISISNVDKVHAINGSLRLPYCQRQKVESISVIDQRLVQEHNDWLFALKRNGICGCCLFTQIEPGLWKAEFYFEDMFHHVMAFESQHCLLSQRLQFQCERVGNVIWLVDLIKVEGHKLLSVAKKLIFVNFFPYFEKLISDSLKLDLSIKHMFSLKCQTFYENAADLPDFPNSDNEVDGIIILDVSTGGIFRLKRYETVELQYNDLQTFTDYEGNSYNMVNSQGSEQNECPVELEVNQIYECSIGLQNKSIRVVGVSHKRRDRTKPNHSSRLFCALEMNEKSSFIYNQVLNAGSQA